MVIQDEQYNNNNNAEGRLAMLATAAASATQN
jgi:hypothetical protein